MLVELGDDLAVESSVILSIRFSIASGEAEVRLREGDGNWWIIHNMTKSKYAALVSRVIAAQKEEYLLKNGG